MRTIKVEGMSCKHCVMAVEKALNGIDGVTGVNVDLDKGEVSYNDTGSVNENVVKQAIEKAGYTVG